MRALFVIFFYLLAFHLYAQIPCWKRSVGVDQGLSNSSVSSIFQDAQGFMWIGTHDGLNRYDGYDFINFRHQFNKLGSIDGNWIVGINSDKQGRLWVATRNGLNIFNQISQSFCHIDYRDGQIVRQLASNVSDVKFDQAGDAFIATTNFGLLICKSGDTVASKIPFVSATGSKTLDYPASAIAINRKVVYITARNIGLLKFDQRTQSLRLVSSQPGNANTMFLDEYNKLWIGADNGLYLYSRNKLSSIYSSRNRIVHLSIVKKNLWIASDGDGILIKSINNTNSPVGLNRIQHDSTLSAWTFSVYLDKDNRIWIGTLRSGIIIYEPAAKGIKTKQNVDRPVLALNEDNDQNIWAGTDGFGVFRISRNSSKLKKYSTMTQPALASNNITSILTDFKHDVWFSTWGGGIYRYDRQLNSLKNYRCINRNTGLPDSHVWQLFEDREKRLWAGSCVEGGVYVFNRKTDGFECFDPKLVNILSFYEDNNGQLWVGTYDALIKVDPLKKNHQHYYTGFAVRDIHPNHRGSFWIATEGGGMQLFDPKSGRFVKYTETDGLANNAVFKILEDNKGQLWISTFNGLSIFNPTTWKFRNLNTENGLLSNEFGYNAAIRLHSGSMAFGSLKGINIINPDSIQDFKKQRTVFLTNVLINNLPLSSQPQFITRKTNEMVEAIEVPYDDASLTLNFVAPHYTYHSNWSYSYRLGGSDKTWFVASRSREVVFNHLREGQYTFEVRVSEPGNLELNTQTLLQITILPPLYRTWWAYTCYIAVGLTLFYVLFKYRARQIRLAYEVDFAKLQVIKEKELNEKKLSFFTNISHELRTPLTLIINPLKNLINDQYQQGIRTELDTMFRNAKRLLNLIDQLLLFRKMEEGGETLRLEMVNLDQLCREIFDCFSQAAAARHIQYSFISTDPALSAFVDYEKIEICVFNLLSNAFKYAPPGGEIILEISGTNGRVVLSVIDNGPGIDVDPASESKIFDRFFQADMGSVGFGIGLHLVKEFVSAHKGTVSYTRNPSKQTVFAIQLTDLQQNVSPGSVAEKSGIHSIFSNAFVPELPKESDDNDSPLLAIQTDTFITGKKMIVIVDDDQEIKDYLRRLLQPLYIIHEAGDGVSGYDLTEKLIPDLVLSDVYMKDGDGITLCRRIKQNELLEYIPVILLTAMSSADVRLEGIEGGADDYITKPFDDKLLLARIDNILRNRSKIQNYFLDTITLNGNFDKVPLNFKTFLEQCIAYVEDNLSDEELSILAFAKEIGLSHSGLYRKIKLVSGLSVNAFIRHIRLRRAALILLTTDCNINEAAYHVGINDPKHFRTQFKKVFGLNPSAYVKKYKGKLNSNLKIIKDTSRRI